MSSGEISHDPMDSIIDWESHHHLLLATQNTVYIVEPLSVSGKDFIMAKVCESPHYVTAVRWKQSADYRGEVKPREKVWAAASTCPTQALTLWLDSKQLRRFRVPEGLDLNQVYGIDFLQGPNLVCYQKTGFIYLFDMS
jgi:hypothetical protein